MNRENRPTGAPFIHCASTVPVRMLDALAATLPAFVWGCYVYGLRAFVIVAIAVASAIATELIFTLVTRRRGNHGVHDLSSCVTGVITGLLLPVTVPLYYPVAAAVAGVFFGKLIYGGLGHNVFNPAAVGIGLMTVAFPETMTRFVQPYTKLPAFDIRISPELLDGLLAESPLSALKRVEIDVSSVAEKFYGFVCGGIGTISALMLLLGLIYLLFRRTVTPHATVAYLGTIVFCAALFGYSKSLEEPFAYAFAQLLSGNAVFAGVFLINDSVTTPMTRNGKIFFGAVCGLLTMIMRLYCAEPDGAVLSVLLVNAFVPLFEKMTMQPVFGRYYK